MAVIPEEVYKKFEEEWAKEEKRLARLGFSKPFISRAKLYALGVLGGYPVKLYTEAPPEFKEKALEYAIDNAITFARSWAYGITEVFAPEKVEKLLEAMHL